MTEHTKTASDNLLVDYVCLNEPFDGLAHCVRFLLESHVEHRRIVTAIQSVSPNFGMPELLRFIENEKK